MKSFRIPFQEFSPLILIVFLLIATSCNKKKITSRSYDETLDEFLEVTGQTFENNPILSEFQSNKFFFSFYNQESKSKYDSLLDSMEIRIRPIYKKYYSQEELEDLIRFFKSPLGKSYIEKNNKIAIEGMKISTETSMKLMKGILENNKFFNPDFKEEK